MASSRANTPSLNIRTQQPKSALTIEEWEAKAPLGDAEIKSVAALKAAVERRPSLPLSTVRVSPFLCSPFIPWNSALLQPSREDSATASRPSTPLQRVKLGSGSRPPTPGSRQPAVAHAHALHPKQPVQTPQQFYDWFALIDRSVAHSQEAHFRQHLLRVSEHLDTCDRLVGRIDQVDTEVASMLDKWKSVEEGGKSLQDASQKLLDERVRIASLISRTRRGARWLRRRFTGPTGGVANGYRDDFGILSGTGACDAPAQSPWRVARSPDRLSLYG